jgi:hypothetical protein
LPAPFPFFFASAAKLWCAAKVVTSAAAKKAHATAREKTLDIRHFLIFFSPLSESVSF